MGRPTNREGVNPPFQVQMTGPLDINLPTQQEMIEAVQAAMVENQDANLRRRLAQNLVNYFSANRTSLETKAFERMFPGITGTIVSPNGIVESVNYIGCGCVAYSGMTRLGTDVFETTMTPNRMIDQLDSAWLPEMLDTDPVQLTYPVLGGCIINGSDYPTYNPAEYKDSVNFGATVFDDSANIIRGPLVQEALPILGYRLIVKAIDNHVGDSRIILTARDTSNVPEETPEKAPVIYKTTLHMGITSVNNFTGLITVLPLRRVGLVNLNGAVTKNQQAQLMFGGYSSERLQDYEVMMNVARWNEGQQEYISDFTLSVDAANAIVYVLPIYPTKGDYPALSKLISSGNVRAYVSYLHTLSNTEV